MKFFLFPPGILNVVVASAPLLKTLPQAVLLTSFLATPKFAHLFDGTSDFYEKLLCMNAQAAALLLGKLAYCIVFRVLPAGDRCLRTSRLLLSTGHGLVLIRILPA